MKKLMDQALKVCDSAEIYYRNVLSTTVSILLGEMQGIESEKKAEIALKIVKDGKMGSAISTSLDDETLVERALISLKHQNSDAEPFPNLPYHAVKSYCEAVANFSTEDMVSMAFDISNRFAEKASEVAMGVAITKTVKTVKLLNSNGFEGVYDYTNMELDTWTLNSQGFTSTNKEHSSGQLPTVTDEDIERQLHLHRLSDVSVEIGNEKMPVVFSGTTMGSLMLRVVGGVNGSNVHKNISPVVGKIGEQLFSDKITIRDDATLPYGMNTMAFDDEGTPAQNTLLYDRGVLKGYLTTVGNAKKIGITPTGNAIKRTLFSKEIEDSPSVFETNLIVEGDNVPDEDIIKGIKRGLYITGVMGAHTGNINQGEFSMNISSGYLIEDGVMVGKVKGAMIAGNIYEMFKDIEAVGTRLEPMRSIFYHMGYSPMVKFSQANLIAK